MKQQPKTCAYCGAEFIPERRNAMYCSSTCRQYSYLKRKTGEAPYERSQQKEIINHELKYTPPLVIEGTVNEEESTPKNVELVSTEINKQSKKSITMNQNQSNINSSNHVSQKQVSYDALLEEAREFFNDQLADWWNHTLGEQQEKSALVAENQRAKNYIKQILNFDGKEITKDEMQKFLFQMNKAINVPGKKSSSFIHGHLTVGEASVQPEIFLEKVRAEKKSSMIFRLEPELRAELEIMLRFMNEFYAHSPEFWLLN